jgi:hypothetical protein
MKNSVTLRGDLILGVLTGVLVGVSLWSAGRSYGFADLRIFGFKVPYYVLAALVAAAVVASRSSVKRLKAEGHTDAVRAIQAIALMIWASMFFGFVKGSSAVVLMWIDIAVAFLVLPISIWLGAQSRTHDRQS